MLYRFWIAYLTISRREILRFTRIWVQTIIPPVVMVALYFVIFGNLIGAQIGDMDGRLILVIGMGDGSYFSISISHIISSVCVCVHDICAHA